MKTLKSTIKEILDVLPIERINNLCEDALNWGGLQGHQRQMLLDYTEYLKDRERLHDVTEFDEIKEFNEIFNELYRFFWQHFHQHHGLYVLTIYEGEEKFEGSHDERFNQMQKLSEQFHEKYNELRILLEEDEAKSIRLRMKPAKEGGRKGYLITLNNEESFFLKESGSLDNFHKFYKNYPRFYDKDHYTKDFANNINKKTGSLQKRIMKFLNTKRHVQILKSDNNTIKNTEALTIDK